MNMQKDPPKFNQPFKPETKSELIFFIFMILVIGFMIFVLVFFVSGSSKDKKVGFLYSMPLINSSRILEMRDYISCAA